MAETKTRKPTGTDAKVQELEERVHFAEALATVLVEEMQNRGILPVHNTWDVLIERAETYVEVSKREKGRGGLIAAFLHNGDDG